jgi:hypothetical protein
MTDTEKLAWMAGIVDGEGCIYLAKSERKDRPSVTFKQSLGVSNCNLKILNEFQNRWGGVIYTYIDKRPNYSNNSQWHCKQSMIEPVLKELLPFLVGKTEQANLVLDYIEHKKNYIRQKGGTEERHGGSSPLSEEERNYRISMYEKCRELNKKGRFKNEQLQT